MEMLSMCRMCLATDIRLCSVSSKLQDLFEKLTALSLIPQEEVSSTRSLSVVSVLHLSLGHSNCDGEHLEEISKGIHHDEPDQRYKQVTDVKMEPQEDRGTQIDGDNQSSPLQVTVHVIKSEPDDVDPDIKMEPQEEHETQIDDDIQCSHLEDTLDVVKREPDDIYTGAENMKLEIDEMAIEEHEPYSAHPSSLSAYDICPKPVNVVLKRNVLNDTTPVTGVPALKKLAKTDSVLTTEPDNENKSVVRDKLTAISDIHESDDKVNVTLHKRVDMYKQTSESNICSIKGGYSSKAHLKLQKTQTHTGEKQFQCDFCNKSVSSEGSLKRHIMYKHTDKKPFNCNVCNKGFSFKEDLKQHTYTHTGEKPFKCELCNKSYTGRNNLTQHMYTHTGDKPFKCDVCHKSFTAKSYLVQHMYTHTGEKPFKCNVCNKCFNSRRTLSRHMYTHTEDKPHKCDVCNKRFTSKTPLTHHMNTHTGEKPFKCEVCNKRFSFKVSLNQHMFTHTGDTPFKCDTCNKSYTTKFYLTQHTMYAHTGEKQFECDVCNKRFKFKCSLKKHMHTHRLFHLLLPKYFPQGK